MSDIVKWIEAHYALGKLEQELGHPLDWRQRRAFLQEYLGIVEPEIKTPMSDN